MPDILRLPNDTNNPTLAGGIYGQYTTKGTPIYHAFNGVNTVGIILIGDGGKYGLHSVPKVLYGGTELTANVDYKFHPGKITSQIQPKTCTLNITTDFFTCNAHGYNNGDFVRLKSINGNLPTPTTIEIHGQSVKYYVINKTTNTFQLSLDNTTPINFTDTGTGTLTIWRANKGFDDPEQGLPTFCPEVENTYSNKAYIEINLNTGLVTANEEPNWENFRIIGIGRNLMDYDDEGTELGLVTDVDLLSNTPLMILDNLLNNLKIEKSRIGFESWKTFRDDGFQDILQRISTNQTSIAQGVTARYYSDQNFETLVVARTENRIDIGGDGTTPPAPGVLAYGFSATFKGRVKPRYSELYTLSIVSDNESVVFINGTQIISANTVGTHTGTYTFIADEVYDLEVRFKQYYLPNPANLYECRLKWQSTSQALEIIPNSRLYLNNQIVKRYDCGVAFSTPTEAYEVHEKLMERCPGYDWTDNDGKIEFLRWDRDLEFTFEYDKLDDDSIATFTSKSLEKSIREIQDRPNFLLATFRDITLTGFPVGYAQGDREQLRLFTDGVPTNNTAMEIGVASRSLAERILENELVLKSDASFLVSKIGGGNASSKIRKNFIVRIKFIDKLNNEVVDSRFLITSHNWGENHSFSALPIKENFYFDEPV